MTRSFSLLTCVASLIVAACSIDAVGPSDGTDVPPPPPPGADAGPQFLCYTGYTSSGQLAHAQMPSGAACDAVTPCVSAQEACSAGGTCVWESCHGDGQWTITLDAPTAGEGETACSDAPPTITLNFAVTVVDKNATAVDADDPSRTWEGQMSDKGGSCSGDFEFAEADGLTTWSIHAVETGVDGTLAGTGHYEVAL